MKTIFKITFLFLLVITLNACIFPPKVKVVATARVVNPSEMQEALSALEKRMEKFNVPAVITQINKTDIRMELLAEEGTEVLKKNVLSSAKLEFYETVKADWLLQELAGRSVPKNESYSEILNKIIPVGHAGSPIVGFAASKDTLRVINFVKSDSLLNASAIHEGSLKLKWGIIDEQGLHPLYLLKTTESGAAEMSGDLIKDAVQIYDQTGQAAISITMPEAPALRWEQFTGRAAKEQFQIAIVLDDLVYSAPGVNTAIPKGMSSISGDFSVEEAQRIATALNLGYLPKMELFSFKTIKD